MFYIEKLRRDHAVENFDCGQEDLNRFLVRFAFANQLANASQTYLGLSDNFIVGFYTIVVGEIAYDDAPDRLTKGLACYPVPVAILARLAVNIDWQGKGVGAGLLKDAMKRILQAADIIGIRAFIVHAKDENARRFYERFNFVSSPTDPLHLYLLIKDIRKIAGL